MTAQNQTTPPPQTALTVAPKREIRVVEDDSPLSYIMDTAKFEHCYRIAEAMSRASLIPQHLKGGTKEETAANCFLVVNQALRWHMDPFIIAPETYAIGGKLSYQGKLVAAVINTRAGLAERLSYKFSGTKGTDDFTVTVSGRFEGEAEPRTVDVSVGQAKTQNQMWTKDPEQKLVYSGSIKWARRYAPEIIMGVVTDDDLDAMREQVAIDNMKLVKSPVFDGPQPPASIPAQVVTATSAPPTTEPEKPKRGKRPTMVESPLDPPPAVPQDAPAQTPVAPIVSDSSTVPPPSTVPATPATPPATPPGPEKPEDTLAKLCAADSITKEQFIVWLRAERWLKKEQTKITEMSEVKLRSLIEIWSQIVSRIKKVNEVK